MTDDRVWLCTEDVHGWEAFQLTRSSAIQSMITSSFSLSVILRVRTLKFRRNSKCSRVRFYSLINSATTKETSHLPRNLYATLGLDPVWNPTDWRVQRCWHPSSSCQSSFVVHLERCPSLEICSEWKCRERSWIYRNEDGRWSIGGWLTMFSFLCSCFKWKKGLKDAESIGTGRKKQRRKMADEKRERGSDWRKDRKETREIVSLRYSSDSSMKRCTFSSQINKESDASGSKHAGIFYSRTHDRIWPSIYLFLLEIWERRQWRRGKKKQSPENGLISSYFSLVKFRLINPHLSHWLDALAKACNTFSFIFVGEIRKNIINYPYLMSLRHEKTKKKEEEKNREKKNQPSFEKSVILSIQI